MSNKNGLRGQEDIINDILKVHNVNQPEKHSVGKGDVKTIFHSHGELIRKLKDIEADIKASPRKSGIH
ncbi:hypothetical protein EHV15_34220 [Paenibacillus oralis]|uniref:Uncharacterized protein n=1 Tax=Paenibacillus oralis TaxID=2490856 RepID=A0A3P3T9E0_9BACL|nr:hypothetical protein [Paenibacillus oralis]RRJ54655.1 hypothetical protein EHV15_34220 [Paenibacillus oralis]